MSKLKTDTKFLNLFKKDKFRWGFSSLGTPDLNIFETIEFAVTHGLDFIELRTLSGTVDILDELENFIEQNQVFVNEIRESNFIVGLNTSITLVGSNDESFEQLLKYGIIAREIENEK